MMTAAKPDTRKGKRLTAVWIIPAVAAVLGVWMVVYTHMSEGPEIRVQFKTAAGLEEGKTSVKFREVEMGLVQQVILSEDLQTVTAVIKMRREAVPLLVEDTRLWVVTARIGGGTVSGLETILSGAYIQISPGTSDEPLHEFVALDEPPLTPIGAPGVRLILLSDRSSSVTSGDPVLYHGFRVGRVESMTFDPESKQIRHIIFIDAPYDKLINSAVRFWDVSGISVSAGASGFRLETGSLDSILLGGVTFGIPPGLKVGALVEDNTEFRLFPRYDDILEAPNLHRAYYVVRFLQSVKGLLPDSPVEYRGIHIGNVERIMMEELVAAQVNEVEEAKGLPIPVLIYIEPARFTLPDTYESVDLMQSAIAKGVRNGLRANIGSGSLLTGAQVVELEYHQNLSPAKIGEFAGVEELPTVITGLSSLEEKINRLLDKANELPLDKTLNTVNLAVTELNRSLKSLRKIMESEQMRRIPDELEGTLTAMRSILENDNLGRVPLELRDTLEALRLILEDEGIKTIPHEIQRTLSAARFQLEGESSEVYQLGRTLKEVEAAARALREFVDALEKSPEALIRGKSETAQ